MKRSVTVEQFIKSNRNHIDRIGRRLDYTNRFLECYRMWIGHGLRILCGNLTPVIVIIDGVEHSGYARFETDEHKGDFKEW
jgi:hypothetical protein